MPARALVKAAFPPPPHSISCSPKTPKTPKARAGVVKPPKTPLTPLANAAAAVNGGRKIAGSNRSVLKRVGRSSSCKGQDISRKATARDKAKGLGSRGKSSSTVAPALGVAVHWGTRDGVGSPAVGNGTCSSIRGGKRKMVDGVGSVVASKRVRSSIAGVAKSPGIAGAAAAASGWHITGGRTRPNQQVRM
jgi:hypothetical protein